MILKSTEIENRAYEVLGVSKESTADEIKYAQRCMILKHHPDRNPEDPNAGEITSLISEAYALITGKTNQATLLEDDFLVASVTENPITHLDNIPTYEEWRRKQFYGSDGTIWPD